MAERPPDNGDDSSVMPAEDRPPGMPRWVKVSGIIAIALVLLVVVVLVFAGGPGGGGHGPGRHTGFGDTGGGTPGIEQAVQPDGGHS